MAERISYRARCGERGPGLVTVYGEQGGAVSTLIYGPGMPDLVPGKLYEIIFEELAEAPAEPAPADPNA